MHDRGLVAWGNPSKQRTAERSSRAGASALIATIPGSQVISTHPRDQEDYCELSARTRLQKGRSLVHAPAIAPY